MPKYQPINLIGGFYTDDSLSWAAQDTVNWLPLAAEVEGTRTVTKLRSPPGLLLFSDISPDPIRGTHNVEGRLFTVSGSSLYEVPTNGVEINRGAIPGVNRVSMAHNQITFGNQLTIVNGDSGYVWNTVTNTLTKITDPGFEGSIQVDFLNGFMIHLDPFGRFWFHSQPADALEFNTLDRYTSESSPDNMVGVKVFQSEVVVFNDSTVDFFGLTGSGELGQVFERKNIVINRGCSSRDSIARINNTLVWLGDDGAIYALNGYREQRISTVPIEQAISGLNWAQAFAEVWEDQGHTVYYLTFPDGHTWGYDFNSGLWTRRESYEMDRWRMASITFWQGRWIVGDFQSGKLYELKWDFFTENGRPLVSYRATGYSHSDQNRVLCPYLELMFDTGWAPNPADLDPLFIQGDAPNSRIGTSYSYAYSATGGFGIYTYSVSAGSLPGGLTLSPDGILSGVSSATGNFSFTVTVTDSLGNTSSVPDTIQISFASDLFVATPLNVNIHSGLTSAYDQIQNIIQGGAKTGIGSTADGATIAISLSASPFFRMYQRNIAGTYIEVPIPLDVMPSATARGIAFTANGTYLHVSQAGTPTKRIYKRSGSTYVQIQTFAGNAEIAKWSPSGEYLAMGSAAPNTMEIYRRSGDVLTLLSYTSALARGVAWTKDSSKLAFTFAAENAGIRVVSVIGNTVTNLNTGSISCPENAAIRWSGNEQFLYVGGGVTAPSLRTYAWSGSAVTASTTPTQPSGTIASIDLSIDGRVLAVATNTGNFALYNASGSSLTLISPTNIPNGGGTSYIQFMNSSDFWT